MDWIQTATLLPDGRVLVVGGDPKSAEVWDPARGTFSPAGSPPETGYGTSTTALSDGRVLIVGGCIGDQGCERLLASAEVWDPETESFSPAGEMAVTRWSHTATALPDGRVLVVGGWEEDGVNVRASAEVWEPGDR